MLDRDGIERPDSYDGHQLEFKHKEKRYAVTDKTYSPRNPFYIFFCFVIRGIAVVALSLIGKIGFGARIHGKKYYRAVKKSGGVIVCNHVHYFDIVLTASLLSPFKKVWVTTIQSNMDIPVAGYFERVLGALPIPDERAKMGMFIKAIDERLQKRNLVAFMPETALWVYYRDLRPFKPSAFRFAAKNSVPVLPVTLSFRMKQKTNKKGETVRKYKFTYDFLPPVYPDKSLSVPDNTDYMLKASHALMEEKIAERNAENLERYGM